VRRLLTVALVAAALAGCGDDGGGGLRAEVPDGYRQFAEGSGEQAAGWGDDNQGNTGGFTVLVGTPEGSDSMAVVELTGFEGYADGLAQAVRTDDATPVDLDDREAFAGVSLDGTELAVQVADDVALVARGNDLDVDDLITLVDATSVPDGDPPSGAPNVTPPDGIRMAVAGSASADLALAFFADADEGYLGGPAAAHGTAWEGRNGDNVLIVLTLPGDAGDVEAVLGWPLVTMGQPAEDSGMTEVDGRDAAWLSTESRNILATTNAAGDLLLVESISAGVDSELLDQATMVDVAESVEQA
jgi:hypothetical protein